jgi:hypothetical protein
MPRCAQRSARDGPAHRAGAGGCAAFPPRRQHPAYTQHALRARQRHGDFDRPLYRRRVLGRSETRHARAYRPGTGALHDCRIQDMLTWIVDQGVRFQPSLGGTLSLGRTNSLASSSTASTAFSLSSDTQKKGGWCSRKWRKPRRSIGFKSPSPRKDGRNF